MASAWTGTAQKAKHAKQALGQTTISVTVLAATSTVKCMLSARVDIAEMILAIFTTAISLASNLQARFD